MLAANGNGFPMWRYLKTSGPEQKLNRITNDEDNNQSSIIQIKPRLQMIANKKSRIYPSPRHIAQPPVFRLCHLVRFLSYSFVHIRGQLYSFDIALKNSLINVDPPSLMTTQDSLPVVLTGVLHKTYHTLG